MKGFTLIEIIVVMGLFSVISFMTIPTSINQYKRYVAKESALNIMHFLRISQNNAKVRLFGMPSGFKILPDSFVVFSGESYVSRFLDVDEVYALPGSVSVEGMQEVIFDEITGIPSTSGIIEVISGGYSYDIYISDNGLVEILQ